MGAGHITCCTASDDAFGCPAGDDALQAADQAFLETTPVEASLFESWDSQAPLLKSASRDFGQRPEDAVSSSAAGQYERSDSVCTQTDVRLQQEAFAAFGSGTEEHRRRSWAALGSGIEEHRRRSWSFADADEHKRRSWLVADAQEHRRRSWTAADVEKQRGAEQLQKALEEQKRAKQERARLAEQARAEKKLEEQRRTKRKLAEKAMRKLKPPLDISPLLDDSPEASLEPLRVSLTEALGRGLHNILISEAEVRLQKWKGVCGSDFSAQGQ